MMVAGKDAFTGSIVDVDELRRQDQRYQKLQEALSQLDTCVAEWRTSKQGSGKADRIVGLSPLK